MTITAEDLVNREVLACVSHLVSTLAQGYGAAVIHVDAYGRKSTNGSDLAELTEQAFELACPVDDWEEAAREAGWRETNPNGAETYWRNDAAKFDGYAMASARAACEEFSIEPYQLEVFEHWAVSDWLADKLEAHGEKVDRDFAGLTVWARTTTGQAIAMDPVIQAIHAELTANR